MEKADQYVELRNLQGGDWYWINRNFLLGYGRTLKPSGIAVYNVLASFANSKTQSCFPTHKTIARLAGTSKRTVSEKIRLLDRLKLIRRERQEGQSIYVLLECAKRNNKGSEVLPLQFESEKSDRQ